MGCASEVGLLRTDDIDFRALRIIVHRLKGSHSPEPQKAKLAPEETPKAMRMRLAAEGKAAKRANRGALRAGYAARTSGKGGGGLFG
jgi:hypothetical protein